MEESDEYQRAATEQCVLNYMDDLYAVWNELEGADLPIEGVVVSKMEFLCRKTLRQSMTAFYITLYILVRTQAEF